MYRESISGLLLAGLLGACQSPLPSSGPSSGELLATRYEQALQDAAHVTPAKVGPLFALNDANPQLARDAQGRIRFVTWKSLDSYTRFIQPATRTASNPDYLLWVTAAPQVQQFCNALLRAQPDMPQDALDLRLKQYLGLPVDYSYDVFVELWVAPANVFRPCTDPAVTTSQCASGFPATRTQVTNIPDYTAFYTRLYMKSFRNEGRMPWTGLGYTYDWGPSRDHIGASEYILAPDAPYEITRVVKTREYCEATR